MKKDKLPVFGGSSNRDVIGYASGLRSAYMIVRRSIDIHPRMTLKVWRRSEVMQDILNAPDGYVYAISYDWGN